MKQSRFLTGSEFASELSKFHLYGTNVASDLESLERLRLVVPQYRMDYPDTVARRLFCERRTEPDVCAQMMGDLEPDGERWTAAVELEKALHKSTNFMAYGRVDHPLINVNADFKQFVQTPADLPFKPWDEYRVDVSSAEYSLLQDGSYVHTYYASWQLLLAAEVADIGIHIRCNLADGLVGLPTERHLLNEWLPTVPHCIT
jgi:hypothetical protein